MKRIIGSILLLLCITLLGIIALRILDIEIVSPTTLVKSTATLLILGIAIIVLIIVYGALLRNNNGGYNRKTGNRAHPKV